MKSLLYTNIGILMALIGAFVTYKLTYNSLLYNPTTHFVVSFISGAALACMTILLIHQYQIKKAQDAKYS